MNIKCGVFFGGSSVEHEVSVISALQAMNAMDKQKIQPIPIYLAKDGSMYTGAELMKIDNYKHINKLLKQSTRVSMSMEGGQLWLIRTVPGVFGNKVTKLDVAFPIVHGTNCEDGSVQGLFEIFKVPYVGCDVLSSAVGMDKAMMKQILMWNKIPTVDFMVFLSRRWFEDAKPITEEIKEKIGFPLMVKPANLGSSVGITKVKTEEELEKAIETAASFADKIVVEKAVMNLREINCAVLGDKHAARASVLEEPISQDSILTYAEKYLNKNAGKGMNFAKRKCPADLSEELEKTVKKLAVQTFQTLGCSGCARVDFLIDTADRNTVYVNEINTIPGSLSFYLWEKAGLSFSALLEEMIELAMKRDRERKELVFTYDENILAMDSWSGLKGAKGN